MLKSMKKTNKQDRDKTKQDKTSRGGIQTRKCALVLINTVVLAENSITVTS